MSAARAVSPTQRSLAYLRKRGALAEVVEHWNPHAKRRHDLFNFIDVVAVEDAWRGVLGVQTTTTANVSHRLAKLRDECAEPMRRWLIAGNRLQIHGWARRGARGTRKLWTVTVREISVDDVTLRPSAAGDPDAAP